MTRVTRKVRGGARAQHTHTKI